MKDLQIACSRFRQNLKFGDLHVVVMQRTSDQWYHCFVALLLPSPSSFLKLPYVFVRSSYGAGLFLSKTSTLIDISCTHLCRSHSWGFRSCSRHILLAKYPENELVRRDFKVWKENERFSSCMLTLSSKPQICWSSRLSRYAEDSKIFASIRAARAARLFMIF